MERFKYSVLLFMYCDDKIAELVFRINIAPELKDKFEVALDKVVKEFIEEVDFSIAEDILSKSKLTKRQAFKLAEEVKSGVAKKHGLS